ncbi:MAG: hypothetical protein KDC92_07890 [Bacteroidetes bacterium]|nr:hypothetical protein [Bacteroidota bacterium]
MVNSNTLNRNLATVIVFVALAIIYMLGINTNPAFGDATGFTLSAIRGYDFATNATSHLLYNIAITTIVKIVGAKNALWALPGFSVLCGLFALFIMLKLLAKLQINWMPSLLAVATMGLGFTFWRCTQITEVYTFNLCFLMVYLHLMVDGMLLSKRTIIMGSLVLALSILVHIQNILWIPAWLLWLWQNYKENGSAHSVIGLVIFTALVSILFIIPLSLQTNTLNSIFFDGGHQDTVLNINPKEVAKGFALAVGFLILNFAFFLIPTIKGVFKLQWPKLFKYAMALMFLLPFGFAARFAVTDNYVFFLPAYLVVILIMTKGIQTQLENWPIKRVKFIFVLPIIFPLAYFTLTKIAESTVQGQKIEQAKWYKGGVSFFTWPPMKNHAGTLNLPHLVEDGKVEMLLNSEIEPNYKMAKELNAILNNH